MDRLIARYTFEEENRPGADSSGHGYDARPCGRKAPWVEMVGGRSAAVFAGGRSGTSYFELPEGIFQDITDQTGLSVVLWANFRKCEDVWQRIFDFGKGKDGPFLFLTRNGRGVCYNGADIAADPMSGYPVDEWTHIAMTVSGTKGGTESSAGPCVYVNGALVADGRISQTASGMYKKLREWFATLEDPKNYTRNYLGRSQFPADEDFEGAISDFRIYGEALKEEEIIDLMCESLTDEEIVVPAADKYLELHRHIVLSGLPLPTSLLGGRVSVVWESDKPELLDAQGRAGNVTKPAAVTLTAHVTKGEASVTKQFDLTVIPKEVFPYTLTVHEDKPVLSISDTLYGLFYEDINNAADGGIYAEMVKNRSFEAFTYDTYDTDSGEDGKSTGRKHTPLDGWYGDVDKLRAEQKGGLNEFFGIGRPDANEVYVTAKEHAVLTNRGFSDRSGNFAMHFCQGEAYDFTVWAKSAHGGRITARLLDAEGNAVSSMVSIEVSGGWKKYGGGGKLAAEKTCLGQLEIAIDGGISVDIVSLFPEKVWGAADEESSATAHANYLGNPNYRLRKDMVEAMRGLHPAFLRFPGGCISEGSYIWENVYDWKDSVGPVEIRKENYNVWGYMMTMGLGYMEYFQLAEDLGATPLPVMACGVLCQARSDYANPAGGKLQEKYIKNFTDLIDFAINTDTEGNEWAALRKSMGHEAPFDLHYLGVGNENWGEEFYASFEEFYEQITSYVRRNYPGYELHIISTVGAQADDTSYQEGWQYLSGNLKGGAAVRFTDGEKSFEREVRWYQYQKDFMETIADEHYYRSNEYLLENADRYHYYARAYHPDGTVADRKISKVFVGEYASTDKNTLAGAVAEAAVMTGFEKNSDVVRLAATAPLFNKMLTEGDEKTYRWTPDCIWFDDEAVWHTPNYYVQQMFAKYLGKKLLHTDFSMYRYGKMKQLIPAGGFEVATGNADILAKRMTVTSCADGSVLFEQDFREELSDKFILYPHTILEKQAEGLLIHAVQDGIAGLYLPGSYSGCRLEVVLERVAGEDGFIVGAGVNDIGKNKNALEYVVGKYGKTALKVWKDGIEGYTLGDYSSSIAAGNLRAAIDETVRTGVEYTVTVDYGAVFQRPGVPAAMDFYGGNGKGVPAYGSAEDGKSVPAYGSAEDGKSVSAYGYVAEGYGAYPHLICSHTAGDYASRVLDYKLEVYNKKIFHSVTADEERVYVKLVNADDHEKKVQIAFCREDGSQARERRAEVVCLTADKQLAKVPNVNKKNAEAVVPVTSQALVQDGRIGLVMPAHSVFVVAVEK